MISIATSCSGLALLKGLHEQGDSNAIDLVVYDAHSPHTSSIETCLSKIDGTLKSIAESLWVNPVCDLNTRAWDKRLPWQLCCNG
ncbi:hypothetical protein [Acinetobacter sp. G11]|uniref:hypothetical protein n=1 Tax=Acinetobacter sp. G11 TaxID=3415989 RepID=UPI003C797FF4